MKGGLDRQSDNAMYLICGRKYLWRGVLASCALPMDVLTCMEHLGSQGQPSSVGNLEQAGRPDGGIIPALIDSGHWSEVGPRPASTSIPSTSMML